MTSLSQAETLADAIVQATNQFEAYIRPSLQEYIDFLPERGSGWTPIRFKSADDYYFQEVDGSQYVFHSEEFYEYGETTNDVVELPFAFIDDPEAFKTNIRESMAAAEKKRTEANRKGTLERIEHYRRQLAVAEASLED